MPLFTTDAIVIRSLPYGESDKIVTFFTKDFGKLKAIVKGARRSRKRFQNALELFAYIRLVFFDRDAGGLARGDGCDLLGSFPKIREDLKKIFYGNYFLELMNEMSGEREANREAFNLLLSFLMILEKTEPEEDQLRMFEIRMLSLFGYRPNMGKCGVCKMSWEDLKETSVLFSAEKGSLVCEPCSRGLRNLFPLSLGTARLVENISRMDADKLHRLRFTSQALSESRHFLPRFIAYQLGKELKSFHAFKMLAEGSRPKEPRDPPGTA